MSRVYGVLVTQGEHSRDAAVFAVRLQQLMTERGLSKRGLGRLVDPEKPERGRRQVLRHLSGQHAPSRASRVKYATVLGLPPLAFVDEDDEESEPVSLAEELLEVVRVQRELNRRIARIARAAA